MPTYEYVCPEGHAFEKFQKMTDRPRANRPRALSSSELGAASSINGVRDRRNGERLVGEADEVADVVAAHEFDHTEAGQSDRAVVMTVFRPQVDA